ncbi:hypothetical protein AALO_G00308900 [Alosa alosa]|uniref:Ribonuclease A-domain domain-containing protein n=1 Tax=Alosa alosa TaxID=278164 RepID=A0AAV6FDA5_9TELE|nr:hypothetical protein AALO_G00308900 [Alosa alosa]
MKIQLLPCLLVLLLCVCGMEPVEGVHETRYEKFLRQHVVNAMNIDDCTSIIKDRKIYAKDNKSGKDKCKPVNTFILTEEQQAKAICHDGETTVRRNKEFKKSTKDFNVVVCHIKDEKKEYPNCEYTPKQEATYILVACDNNKLPVHLEPH